VRRGKREQKTQRRMAGRPHQQPGEKLSP
jgi:hypothetical protein